MCKSSLVQVYYQSFEDVMTISKEDADRIQPELKKICAIIGRLTEAFHKLLKIDNQDVFAYVFQIMIIDDSTLGPLLIAFWEKYGDAINHSNKKAVELLQLSDVPSIIRQLELEVIR